jgi:predicted nucleic acid-binding Zn ribbon protein
MATYVYQCGCGYREEHSHGMTESMTIICSYCDIDLVRKPQLASVSFKGTGWGKD